MIESKIEWYKPEEKIPEPCEALLLVLKCEENFIFIGSYDPEMGSSYLRNFIKHDERFNTHFSQYEIKYWAYVPSVADLE